MRKSEEIRTAFAPRERLNEFRSFFLVGIGGAGMAAVAEMLLQRGFTVKGSDSTEQPTLDHLRALGATVFLGHHADSVQPGYALILTDAIDLATSPEVARARELGLPLFRRSQALGWLLGNRKVIAVTGTHGKTTTTGMIGAALKGAGLDPLIVVGAEVPEFGGSVVFGGGDWAVVEACEAYDSFHDLDPEIAVLTNLESDHLDFHENYENLRSSVDRFIQRAPRGVVYCAEDAGASEVARGTHGIPYTAELFAETGKPMVAPGRHNLLNAGAALSIVRLLGVDEEKATAAISRFGGAARRLQTVRADGPTIIDDYAHHPTEVAASIRALRERYAHQRLVVVFQPHLYSRTAQYVHEFAEALSLADFVVVTDIYPAREDPLPGVSSACIAELLTVPHLYVPSRHLLARTLKRLAQPDDVIVGMGAGNIGEFAPALARMMERTDSPLVWVCFGGDSAEREVSLHSGRQVHNALVARGWNAKLVDVSDMLLRPVPTLPAERPDVAVLAVHGTHAEDGAIQGLFELMHVPYSGSNLQASAIAMDKNLTKQVLAAHGVNVPQGRLVSSADGELTLPGVSEYVVKPNAQGSTVGLTFVTDANELRAAVEKALQYSPTALIEEWVHGTEISVPVLGDRALPAVEINPKSGQYDFTNKYVPGATEEICPARLTPAQTEEAARLSLLCHQALGCSAATRTDMLVLPDRIVVLEVNTLPGMTKTSLFPLSASVAGIDFESLCEWLVKDALARA